MSDSVILPHILALVVGTLSVRGPTFDHFRLDVRRIRISGGLSALDGLCQLLADLTQRLVVRSEVTQATSRGIAWLTGQPERDWSELDNDYFLPRPNRPLQARYRTFCSLIG
jgi:glycerol kinase